MTKFWFTAMAIFLSGEAVACSCAEYDIEKSYNQYPHIFVGTVKKIETKGAGFRSDYQLEYVTLKMDKVYKGAQGTEIEVTTLSGRGACGFPFKLDVQYVVFAYEDQKNVAVSSCSPTIHTEKREEYFEKKRLTVLGFLAQKNGIE